MTKLKSDNKQALIAERHFIRAIQRAGIRLDTAYLYGSHVLGTTHRDSDIDVALVSKDFTGRFSSDWEKIKLAVHSADSRIQHVRYHPKKFVDENPLVWEIKTTGIQLVGKPIGKSKRSLNIPAIVKFWRTSADYHWHTAQTLFKVRSYDYALKFARLYIEELLKAIIAHRSRAHPPFRRKLIEYADQAALPLTDAQRKFLDRVDEYDLDARNNEDELARYEKYSRKFCVSELEKICKYGKWLASLTESQRNKRL